MNRVKKELQQRVNVVSHPDWPNFIQTNEFTGSFKILDNIIMNVEKSFEYYYTKVMSIISQQYPQVAQGITSNLGNGPFAPIAPEIPIYELKNNWLGSLGNSP